MAPGMFMRGQMNNDGEGDTTKEAQELTEGTPLVVDLDGTLIRTNLLHEAALQLLRKYPFRGLFLIFYWLCRGKSYLKCQLAAHIEVDVTTLPYDPIILAFLKEEKERRPFLVLATASHQNYAEGVAEHLGIFDKVLATDEFCNLSAERKEAALNEYIGKGKFDYIGNSTDDLKVWRSCRSAWVVSGSRRLLTEAQKVTTVGGIFATPRTVVKSWGKALRLHQWLKNILLFVPLLASHQFLNLNLLVDGFLAFLAISLCASSVYILNDLLDIPADRLHTTKRKRMFASGELSVAEGVVVFPILFLASMVLALNTLRVEFVLVLLAYYLLTIMYSFYLKRLVMVDVITLSLLYTIRIVAGAYAFNLDLTFWMLGFSIFIFLSLALIKRYAELEAVRSAGSSDKAPGRGYYPEDLSILASLGSASGYIAVLILALYIQDDRTISLYRYPELIWMACPVLLFWISRAWLLTHRGEMHDDPVIFAVKDRVSLITGVVFGLVFWFAI